MMIWINLAGLILIGLIVWWFWLYKYHLLFYANSRLALDNRIFDHHGRVFRCSRFNHRFIHSIICIGSNLHNDRSNYIGS